MQTIPWHSAAVIMGGIALIYSKAQQISRTNCTAAYFNLDMQCDTMRMLCSEGDVTIITGRGQTLRGKYAALGQKGLMRV